MCIHRTMPAKIRCSNGPIDFGQQLKIERLNEGNKETSIECKIGEDNIENNINQQQPSFLDWALMSSRQLQIR